MNLRKDEVFWQLAEAGYTPLMESWTVKENTMLGKATPAFLEKLKNDARFANGIFYGLHRDVGTKLEDFRSYRGALGPGSLQVVIDRKTLVVYADVDNFSPYEDLVNFFGHTGEVLAGVWRKLWNRR